VGRDGTPSGQACTASSGQTSKKELQTMFNKVILIGRLGKNAEVKTTQNKVCFRQACVVEESGLFLCGFAATTSG